MLFSKSSGRRHQNLGSQHRTLALFPAGLPLISYQVEILRILKLIFSQSVVSPFHTSCSRFGGNYRSSEINHWETPWCGNDNRYLQSCYCTWRRCRRLWYHRSQLFYCMDCFVSCWAFRTWHIYMVNLLDIYTVPEGNHPFVNVCLSILLTMATVFSQHMGRTSLLRNQIYWKPSWDTKTWFCVPWNKLYPLTLRYDQVIVQSNDSYRIIEYYL